MKIIQNIWRSSATMGKEASEAAKVLGALGASKGGRARNSVLTDEEKSEIGRKAVQARWRKAGKEQPKDTSEQPAVDRSEEEVSPTPQMPFSMFRGHLTIGDVELECHVLNDLRRVLTQREMVRILSGGRESGDLGRYITRHPLYGADRTPGPMIQFVVSGAARSVAFGYEATVLIDICDRYLQARDLGLLRAGQMKLAAQAEIVIRACAKVGIIALIDEATGYQKVREKNALQLKLQAFVADEIQEWARVFPPSFWIELARIEGVRYDPRSRPLRWGKYIMAFVYDAIDENVGAWLRSNNPNPRFLQNHHQWLKKFGREKVVEQITKVVTIMQLCDNMQQFKAKFAHLFRRSPLQLEFDWM